MPRNCDSCGVAYEAKRKSSRFCSERCRKRAQRGAVVTLPSPKAKASESAVEPASVRAAVLAELVAAGREGTALGTQALALAGRIDAGGTDASVAAISRELRATMDVALRNAAKAADGLDEIAARRERKAAGA